MVNEDIRARVVSYIQHQSTKSNEEIAGLVEANQVRLIELLGALDDAAATKAPEGEGEWSVRDLTRHVVTAERGVTMLVERLARGIAAPPNASAERAVGIMAPDGGAEFSAIVADLRAANAKMLETILALPADPDLDTRSLHPFFGELNCREWAVFQRVHDQDHIQHAERIIAAVR